jgi:S1-C subfamily serine protease
MAAMLLILPATSFAETNEAVLSACESVVRIYTYSSSIGQGYIGSGFAIGPEGQPVELIVTNCHVITDDTGISATRYTWCFRILNTGVHTDGDAVSYDLTIDYAILSIQPPPRENLWR